MAIELNSSTFDKHISSGLALVDFWAPWCGPCQMLGPVINQLSEEIKDVKIGKVNVDENEQLTEKYQVSAMPTLILFKNGEIIDRRTGVMPASEIRKWIEENR
jgi:thioredoxin 1